MFPNLKASTETISLRLPTALLSDLKVLANKRDVPYQSLLKVYLADRVTRETIGGTRPNKALQPTSRARGDRARPTKPIRARLAVEAGRFLAGQDDGTRQPTSDGDERS